MSFGFALVILVVVVLIGTLPAWPYSRSWGYMPTGIVGILLLVLIALLFLGH